MDAENQCCVARCHAVLPAVGKCISVYKDRLWTVEYRECGYIVMPNSVHTVPQMTLAAMCCQMGTGRASIKYPRSPNRR